MKIIHLRIEDIEDIDFSNWIYKNLESSKLSRPLYIKFHRIEFRNINWNLELSKSLLK